MSTIIVLVILGLVIFIPLIAIIWTLRKRRPRAILSAVLGAAGFFLKMS